MSEAIRSRSVSRTTISLSARNWSCTCLRYRLSSPVTVTMAAETATLNSQPLGKVPVHQMPSPAITPVAQLSAVTTYGSVYAA